MPVDVFVGMQFGSEGKGAVCARVARKYDFAVRTGAPNAGHTVIHDGIKYKMRSVPCAWVNENTRLYIGAGGLINPKVLTEELKSLPNQAVNRLRIDERAGVVLPEDIEEEEAVGMNAKIGSTSEGVGPAQARKMLRRHSETAKDVPALRPFIGDVTGTLHESMRADAWGMLEGTQGFGLCLNHGHYPYVTSRDVTAAALLNDAGLAPKDCRHVFGVVRTYPIRVAGNSGPMGAEEITWATVEQRCGAPAGSIVEKTTVTNRVRRVSEFSWTELQRAVDVNKPDGLFITFIDYLGYEMHGATKIEQLNKAARDFIGSVQSFTNIPVMAVSTGPEPQHQVWLKSFYGIEPDEWYEKEVVKQGRNS